MLKQNIKRAQDRMKRFADKKHSEIEFNIDDWVLVKLQPYRQHSVQLRRYQKLALVYFGPFKILQRIGAVAYKLDLPKYSKIHPVFHVSLLKQYHRTEPPQSYMPLPLFSVPEGPLSQPITVLDTRVVMKSGNQTSQVLIQWDGSQYPTWEDVDVIKTQYPDLDLEDKVSITGGGIVTTIEKMDPISNVQGPTSEPTILRRSQRIRRKPGKLRDLEGEG